MVDAKEEFSLVPGGPLYQVLPRTGLIRPPFGNVGWRIGVLTGLAWLPLLPLAILGRRFAGGVQVPFLYDFEVHARLLFALPLMILAELVVYIRMRTIRARFLERQIITESSRPAFDAVVASAMRLRNSVSIETAFLLILLLAGRFIWRQALALHSESWYATLTSSGPSETLAGY